VVWFCCTFLLLMKQSILLLIRPLLKKLDCCSVQEASDVNEEGAVVAWQCSTAYSSCDSKSFGKMGLGNSWAPALQPRSGTIGLSSLPQHEKNIFMPRNSNHMMMSSMRCKHGCMVRIPPSIDRILRNGFHA
jgi:hypothetical protein